MADLPTTAQKLSMDDFMRLYSEEGPFEIIDGERIPMTPQVTRSGRVAVRLLRALSDYVETHSLGEVFMEVPFVITYGANWVQDSRVPDLMFVLADRLQKLAADDPAWESKPLVLVPDLVVEVVSPSDSYSKINRKIEGYLADGVRLVWLIDPEPRTVSVHVAGSQQFTRMSGEDTLAGGDVISGFEMPIASLF